MDVYWLQDGKQTLLKKVGPTRITFLGREHTIIEMSTTIRSMARPLLMTAFRRHVDFS
jgi:hypothetical protein